MGDREEHERMGCAVNARGGREVDLYENDVQRTSTADHRRRISGGSMTTEEGKYEHAGKLAD